MTRRRHDGFDLAAALRVVSFTPRASDTAALVDLAAGADEAVAKLAQRALVGLGDAAESVLLARLETGADRVVVLRVLGQLARDEARRARLLPILAGHVSDDDGRAARAAIGALGRVGGGEDALLAALDQHPDLPTQRALTDSLGKTGGARALAKLRAVDGGALQAVVDRAVLRLGRDQARAGESAFDPDRRPPTPAAVVASCRGGVEPFLVDELAQYDAHVLRPGAVGLRLDRPFATLFATARTFIRAGFALADEKPGPDAVARALTSPAALALLRGLTRGQVRFRVAFTRGGHRRAEVLRIAHEVARRAPDVLNDPTLSPWEAEVRERHDAVSVTLFPRVDDPRFAYRVGDVPAASHPTLAAALVRAAGVRGDDVVWDPFVGSGTELVEAARAGARTLHGGDLDERAIAVAQGNLAAAGVRATLRVADARAGAPRGTTLILTNPPMGRRVLDEEQLGPLLDAVVDLAARSLPRGGRLAWISPLPERTVARAVERLLAVTLRQRVDMGGFSAEFQVFARG